MTECTQSTFEFAPHFSRQVVARFDGGTITTDGGGLLLRETDRRLNLLPRFAECFLDGRSPLLVEHTVEQLVSQRVYGLALGYEDLNDHEQLNCVKTRYCECWRGKPMWGTGRWQARERLTAWR